MRALRTLLCLMVLLDAGGIPLAAAPVATPNFTTGYEIRETQNPAPRADWYNYLDLAALAAGLTLASYFALWTRSRRGLFLLAIASLVWLGFWRNGCICPIGAIQNVTLGLTDPSYAVPLVVVAFFALPLVFTLFFGRTFCAAVCPLGAIQELVAVRPVKVPKWLDHALGLLAYVYLGLAVLLAATGTAFVICRYDPFVAFFRRTAGVNMLIFGGCFLLVGMFVGRPYCRYLCPYGAILGLLSNVAKWHVRIPPNECIQCRLCEEACPYGAIKEPTVLQSAAERVRGRRRLVLLVLLLPVLVVLGVLLGRHLEGPLGRLHATIRQAERVHAEDTGTVQGATDATDAFRATGRPVQDLYREAVQQSRKLADAGGWFGGWVGLVLGAKLIHLSLRRRRSDYQPERTNCVACGRCFWYCPNEQVRLGLIETKQSAISNQFSAISYQQSELTGPDP